MGFKLETLVDYEKGHGYREEKIHAVAGIGTHMDAPCHAIKGGLSISDLTLERLIVPACVLNIAEKANADYQISATDIEATKKNMAKFPKTVFLLLTQVGVVFGRILFATVMMIKGNCIFPLLQPRVCRKAFEQRNCWIGNRHFISRH